MRTRTNRIYTVPAAVGIAVPASTAAGPGVTAVGAIPFTFPRRCFVQGILAIPRSNAAANLIEVIAAGLGMTVSDEVNDLIVSDSRGTLAPATGGTFVPTAANLIALHGFALRPYPLQRPVAGNDKWQIQLQNSVASIATMAGIYIFAEVDTQ